MGQPNSETFGARVRRLRRAAGFSSREAYAAAINNPAVSAAVIKNIEAGRKADISVVHLFELSYPLGVSPLVLLLDFARPNDLAQIQGLGPNFEEATIRDIDEWVTEPASYAPLVFATDDYRERPLEVHQMFVAREYKLAKWSAAVTEENTKTNVANGQSDQHFYGKPPKLEQDERDKRHRFLNRNSAFSAQVRRMVEDRARELGVDLSEDRDAE